MSAAPHELELGWLPERVVLAPDLVGRALVDPETGRVLDLWREKRIRPIVSRALLLRYLRLLRVMGLEERLLRRWGWWFADPRRVDFIGDGEGDDAGTVALCNALAVRGQAAFVVHGGTVEIPATQAPWLSSGELIGRLARSSARGSPA